MHATGLPSLGPSKHQVLPAGLPACLPARPPCLPATPMHMRGMLSTTDMLASHHSVYSVHSPCQTRARRPAWHAAPAPQAWHCTAPHQGHSRVAAGPQQGHSRTAAGSQQEAPSTQVHVTLEKGPLPPQGVSRPPSPGPAQPHPPLPVLRCSEHHPQGLWCMRAQRCTSRAPVDGWRASSAVGAPGNRAAGQQGLAGQQCSRGCESLKRWPQPESHPKEAHCTSVGRCTTVDWSPCCSRQPA